MKATSIYTTEKKAFIFAADSEQRGLNATLKAINATKKMGEASRTLAADALNWDVFKSAADYVAYLKNHLPMVFNEAGALCSVKVVEDTTENRDFFAANEPREIMVNEKPMLRVMLPKVKFTCTEVYNLAKKAAQGVKKAEKAAEKAAKAAANEAKKAERTAAKIAKLQKQLAELQK